MKHCMRIALLLLATPAAHAQFDAPAPPDDPASAMFTLDAILERLQSGTPGAPRPGAFVEPASGPASTGANLNAVMAAAPFPDDLSGALPADCLEGRVFWSLNTMAWGRQTCTMPDNGAVLLQPGATDVPIAAGFHNGSGVAVGDVDLAPGNIRAGVELFGVSGDPNVVDTSTGTAGAADLAAGAVAWVDGVEIIGTATPPLRFIDNGDGTITDTRTGLIWLRDATCGQLPGANSQALYSWLDAFSSVNALASGSCGLSDGSSAGDWRLPRMGQLWSLIDPRRSTPAITNAAGTGAWAPGDAFIGLGRNGFHWTSDPAPCAPLFPSTFSCHGVIILNNGAQSLNVDGGGAFILPVKR